MLRRIYCGTIVTLAAALLGAGCAADGSVEPYVIAGDTLLDEQEREEQRRWTDQKGRYRADLRAQGGAPLR